MNIIPAIDLQNNKCVRLKRGKSHLKTIYNNNPVDQAIIFESAGCTNLHIVDLDAAIKNNSLNNETIIKIKKNVSLEIQLGGGIRTYDQAKYWLDNGIDSLIIGSMAIKDPKVLLKIIKEFPKKIIIAIDDNNNKAMISGWLETSKETPKKIITYFDRENLKGFIFTDINRDGTLMGIDSNKIINFSKNTKKDIIVGGGVKNINDIKKICSLKKKNITGIVIGKAYYSGTINLEEAIKVSKNA